MWASVYWDDENDPEGNTAHIAPSLTKEEVEEVLLDDTILTVLGGRRKKKPRKFGWTSTGKHIIVIWRELCDDPRLLYPETAYPVDEKMSRN